MKQMVKRRSNFDILSDIDGINLAQLKHLIEDQIPNVDPDTVTFETECDYDNTSLYLVYKTLETDAEYEKRLKREKKAREKALAKAQTKNEKEKLAKEQRYNEYLKLKKEFE